MLPDLDAVASSSVLFVLGLLLLPKREWRSIPRRLRAAARDERDHVFGPPPWLGPPPRDAARRWLWLMGRELPRAVELGIPLHALAVLAETRGAERRLAREEAWPETRTGLLYRHLTGQIAEQALLHRLQQRGLLPPAPKLRWDPPVQEPMPPVSMFVEAQRWLESLRDDQVGEPEPAPRRMVQPAASPSSALEIQTLGRIRICANGEDFAPGLLHRPALGFTWLYLLARAARQHDDRVTRAALGDELFPRTSPERQRRKLSQRLNEVSSGLP